MAGVKSVYTCSECGSQFSKWFGKCPNCGEWNTLTEEIIAEKKSSALNSRAVSGHAVKLNRLDDIRFEEEQRYTTGIAELDRVLGGGIVKGSVVLIGGEPGAGKSTLLLQMCGKIADSADVMYFSGEESAHQIKLRADRLGVSSSRISVICETDIDSIIASVNSNLPDLVVIDSIQTMQLDGVSSSPGSVTQVRECTSALMRMAKALEIPVFIVGHVNKDGAIAGPKIMEHIVDTVLYFEGDRFLSYRILRAAKNRFGSTNEIGMFDMTGTGLVCVDNPSMVMLEGHDSAAPGSCITCIMEGSRPIMAEIQALATKTAFGTARRTSSGFDYNRVNLLLAVLEKRAGYYYSSMDVYLNAVGGIMLNDPSVDAAVCLALISAVLDKPVPQRMIVFGEVGLGGEVRSVGNIDLRISEAQRLGFTSCIIPKSCLSKISGGYSIEINGVSNVKELGRYLQKNE